MKNKISFPGIEAPSSKYKITLIKTPGLKSIPDPMPSPEMSLHLPGAAPKRWNSQKAIGLTLILLGSAADGVVEGFEFDSRSSFERKYEVPPISYAGSLSWKMAYKNNNPELGFKSRFHKWHGAFDLYHLLDDLRTVGYGLGGGFYGWGLLKSRPKWQQVMIEGAAVFAVSATVKSIGMRWVRN